ncbi:serine/threonine-protein kinase STY46 isoform X2 [Beta vulgaris subsp. vulgaris]|uniref:serine/threonine-protein kinase STY46 isoform X2 n=1 Tax=Beta vulgaris subsp. vulgaris TaxID=3555 RepID=UPI00053F5EA7|nr:serine/threonine-protein kinase STY46 isoform X2 [Beta vulgaris subsp. vulgaris]
MELIEGVGESSSPPRSFGGGAAVGVLYEIRNDVYNRLMEIGNEEAVSNPDFREILDSHFNRLPPSYGLDVNMDRAEDVLLHRKLLALAKDPEKRPVFHVRCLEDFKPEGSKEHPTESVSRPPLDANHGGNVQSKEEEWAFEPCSKLEDLNLEVRQAPGLMEKRQEIGHAPIHEVIFSAPDKPKLLSQLSALLSDLGLDIREAHVFSTTDGYSLDVFVVDGWPVEDAGSLRKAMEEAIDKSEGSWSGSSHSKFSVKKALAAGGVRGNWEIDRSLLKIGEKVASGSCGDLYQGVYLSQDVAVKILRSEHLTEASEDEFAQEVAILREVQHENVVRFIGACTKSPDLCIVTEYMPGGSLYNYLHKNKRALKVSELLKFAIDVSKGMEYLHLNDIIHRDLKSANLLMDNLQVVKVADFGVARFLHQEGVMTAETGTYRWMAPEVINHQPYDQKADVFSFAIVLWELVTAKIPYENMTPLQAALGVRQGLRPDIPRGIHPRLSDLMLRCWDVAPIKRPPFSIIRVELEDLLKNFQNICRKLLQHL